jgi:hypothetical protein
MDKQLQEVKVVKKQLSRRRFLRGASVIAGAAVPFIGTSRASAASTFPIRIDATQLVYHNFIIPGQTGWISARSVQTLPLAPGRYNFQIASGYYADFSFQVTPAGTVDYDPAFNAFLGGRGSSTLTIAGFPVTLDARYLSGAGVLLVVGGADWIAHRTVRMVPASHYSVQQGSGQVADFRFKIGLDGKFAYQPAHEYSAGGFLRGNGSSTLEFLGYPLLVDARAAGGAGLTIHPIWGMPFTTTAVQYANLLPAASFSLQVNSGVVTNARFSLNTSGVFSIAPSLAPYLALDTFNGLRRLRALGPLP